MLVWSWLAGVALAGDWAATIDRVIPSVLVLRYENPRAFDGRRMGAPQASGFVVDAERGIVLTNRHVVGSGPQVARALFPNQEEIAIEPLYSDPVHDFGFYRYDPASVKLNRPVSLRLDPDGARIGEEIRLIGNDAGEQISILDGTISRIDRPAPWWDVNTFYVQAASDSSGGSSGSPVFDIEGDVVALNAGGRVQQSTSYYLRLERVKVALEHLQRGEVPPRGTIMTELEYRPYDELTRLGLSAASESAAREAWDGTGLLTVATVGKGGPAEGLLEPGDILLQIDGEPVYAFAALEAALDGRVGGSVELALERSGKPVVVRVDVADLHALAPSSFLRFADGSFHEVGYLPTLRNNRPPEGVLVARPGEVFHTVPRDSILHSVAGVPIDSLDTLQSTLQGMEIGQVATVRYSALNRPTTEQVARIQMAPTVFPDERCHRDASWIWSCETVTHPTARRLPPPATVVAQEVEHRAARGVAARLVTVASESAFPLNTSTATYWESVGIVVDAEAGLVLTDRYGVPNEAARVTVQAGDAPPVPAELVALDPLYNSALVRFDPALLDFGDLEPLEWAEGVPEPGKKHYAALLDTDGRAFSEEKTFSRFDELTLRATTHPKFRADNMTTLKFGKIERAVVGGVIVDRKGRVVALYQRFNNEQKQSPSPSLNAVSPAAARELLAGVVPRYPGFELRRKTLAEAREAGMPADVAEALRAHRPYDPVAMEVWRVDPTVETDVAVGDFVVGIDGRAVADFRDLQERLAAKNTVRVVRDGEVLEVPTTTVDLSDRGHRRAVLWAGAWIQEEHFEVARESGTPPAGVYVSWYYGGSPADRYKLGYARRIVAVDGEPVSGLPAFVEAVSGIADGASVKLTLQSLQGRKSAVTLRPDDVWWPTLVVERGPDGWERVE